MERVATGITGLDDLVEGGLPKGSAVLVSGGSGTGKTILCLQYIFWGASRYKEPGIYVTLESGLHNIVWDMASFNWDIKALQDKNLMKIYRVNMNAESNFSSPSERIIAELETIAKIVAEMKAKRLAIDSTTAFGLWIKSEGEMRNLFFKFTEALKEIGCTTLLVADTKGGKMDFSAFGVEEFICDGIIALYFTPPHRSVFIRKMRGTSHSKTVHPFEIGVKGIEIKPKDEVMWDAIK